MRNKICKCGKIVQDRCLYCHPVTHAQTTAQRGYGNQHRKDSERYRIKKPVCEMCIMEDAKAMRGLNPSAALHHIQKIVTHPHLQHEESNWLAVCDEHHEILENNAKLGMEVKQWSRRCTHN